jgi:hypothetical protein
MRRFSLIAALIVGLAVATSVLGGAALPHASFAAEQPKTTPLLHISLDASAAIVPGAAFWRLFRTTIAPNSGYPLAIHSGLLLWRVESGTVRVTVQGPTLVARAKSPDAWKDAPQSTEFGAKAGDALAFFPGTAMQYADTSKSSARVLAAIVIPNGPNHPASISYVGNPPTQDQVDAISTEILGEGVADAIAGGVTIAIDQVDLTTGQPLPATAGPTLESVAKGSVKFKVVSGSAQVADASQGFPQAVDVGDTVTLKKSQGVFFSDGVAETPRGSALADVTLLRWTTTSTDATSSDVKPAKIKITGPPAPTATPEAGTGTPTVREAATPTSLGTPNGE